MTRARPTLPQGHGELLVSPPLDAWFSLAQESNATASAWDVQVDGESLVRLRAAARREALAEAMAFCERFGIEVAAIPDENPLVIATGHQPLLFHPGVWIKNFLVDRCATGLTAAGRGAVGLNLIVDSDGFDAVTLVAPCLGTDVKRCIQYLAVGTRDGSYSLASVPSADEIDAFCQGGRSMLATLPAPAIGRHFEEFCAQLRETAPQAENLAELLAVSRRRFEASAKTRYLELPVTRMASTRTFGRFVQHLARNAEAFCSAYNQELSAFRAATQTRSAAQPFPDLARVDSTVELPLWTLDGGARRTVWASSEGVLVARTADDAGFEALAADAALAPKALALTMYARLFLSDLFVHGVGGGRYDRVTDGVIARFFGVQAPPFAVASMTVYLPLGGHAVGEEELAEARRRVNRLEHNPDAMLAEVEFDSAEEQARAMDLAQEKHSLVERIKDPDQDKKALGARIREVNAQLGALLSPFASQIKAELESLEGQAASAEVFTDRTYPFCLWNPLEIQDKAR